MRAVAERLVRRRAAAAQRERAFRNLIRVPVPIHHGHVVAFDEIRTVLSDFDARHVVPQLDFCMDARKSAFDFVLDILSISNSIASTGESGLSTLRSTQMRFRSSFGISSSSL